MQFSPGVKFTVGYKKKGIKENQWSKASTIHNLDSLHLNLLDFNLLNSMINPC